MGGGWERQEGEEGGGDEGRGGGGRRGGRIEAGAGLFEGDLAALIQDMCP